MGEAYQALSEVRLEYGEFDVENLGKVMKNSLKSLGLLTARVEEGIDGMSGGVVEAGQQPMPLGGTSLILNKIAYARSLCNQGDEGFVPLFYVADYDGVHHELLNTRLPNPSQTGLLISYPAPIEYDGSPIYTLPNPPEDWLKENIERIIGEYKGLLNGVDQNIQEGVLRNLDHALTIIKNAYYSTDNVSDWSTKILGSLVNIESELGVPFLISSDLEIRKCFIKGYEFLLSEPIRTKFIESSNAAVDLIEKEGYYPQIGRRGKDYVPFFMECLTPECHRNRIELKYIRDSGSKAEIRGKCEKCDEIYSFSFNISKPDLSDIQEWITPRVDSRQVIVDSALPVLAHIGGPGETSYYAEVIPGVQPLDIPFPVFLRYTRTFYNTPWNKKFAEELEKEDLPTMTGDSLFEALSSWVKARNSEDERKLKKAHQEMRKAIMDPYSKLLEEKERLEEKVGEIKGKLSEPEGREGRLKVMQRKQNRLKLIENYLSMAYGQFSPERFGQEVSWAWLDAAAVAGVNDVLDMYLREYNRNTPNSSMFFVNL
jgi:uncharacterized protein YllA (UPF0747 family)